MVPHNTRNRALINYYARLIPKGQWKIEDVPENLRASVEEAIKASEPVEQVVDEVAKEEPLN